MLLILPSFKSHLWDFTKTFQIILLLNITKPGKIYFHNKKFGKVLSLRKKIPKQDGIMQDIINFHSCVSVSNCCNEHNKTKELLERNASRFERGRHKEVISIFHGLGFVKQEFTFVRLVGKHFDGLWWGVCTAHGYWGSGGAGGRDMRGFFPFSSWLNR